MPRCPDGPTEAHSTNINVHVLNDFRVGEHLKSKAELMIRLRIITVKANREFRVTHSDRTRFIATCVEKSCTWRIRVLYSKRHGAWVVRAYVTGHSCSIDARFKRHRGSATSEVIAHMVKDDNNHPWDIVRMLEKVYGIKISYWKAWKAKDIAAQLVRGSPESSFMGLPSYFWLLAQANPGTYTAYNLDPNNCFVQCFLALGPSIAGFASFIRPVIAVDACFLKGRYQGKLYIATCMDGNKQIYPLAFGVAGNESDASWSWFFQQLHRVVGQRDDLVIISDRHKSIEKCCKAEFPTAVYGICMYHLGLNVHHKFNVAAEEFLYYSAKAFTEIDFESMNAVLRVSREFPIIALFETLRLKLQEWFHDRLGSANSCHSMLTPYAERKLGKRDDRSRHYAVHPISESRFYVRDGERDATVDIKEGNCTCYKFQLNQMPCAHAIKAARQRSISPYSLCSRFYTTECLRQAYALPMNPVPHRSEWYRLVPQSVKDAVVYPPIVENKMGRRKKKRIPSQGEGAVKVRKCGRCKGVGHNRQTCTGKEYVPPPSGNAKQ